MSDHTKLAEEIAHEIFVGTCPHNLPINVNEHVWKRECIHCVNNAISKALSHLEEEVSENKNREIDRLNSCLIFLQGPLSALISGTSVEGMNKVAQSIMEYMRDFRDGKSWEEVLKQKEGGMK